MSITDIIDLKNTQMKRLMLLLLISGSIAVSCNKNDDDSNPEVNVSERIVGHWNLDRREISGLMEDLEVCELSTNIDFLGNGNFQIELFVGDDLEDCQSASNTGNWEYIGEDKINIQLYLVLNISHS